MSVKSVDILYGLWFQLGFLEGVLRMHHSSLQSLWWLPWSLSSPQLCSQPSPPPPTTTTTTELQRVIMQWNTLCCLLHFFPRKKDSSTAHYSITQYTFFQCSFFLTEKKRWSEREKNPQQCMTTAQRKEEEGKNEIVQHITRFSLAEKQLSFFSLLSSRKTTLGFHSCSPITHIFLCSTVITW